MLGCKIWRLVILRLRRRSSAHQRLRLPSSSMLQQVCCEQRNGEFAATGTAARSSDVQHCLIYSLSRFPPAGATGQLSWTPISLAIVAFALRIPYLYNAEEDS